MPAVSQASFHSQPTNVRLAKRSQEAHFALVHAPTRSFNFNFHSKTEKKDAKTTGGDSSYEKSFEDLLGKT
jgi:hypothetical protein